MGGTSGAQTDDHLFARMASLCVGTMHAIIGMGWMQTSTCQFPCPKLYTIIYYIILYIFLILWFEVVLATHACPSLEHVDILPVACATLLETAGVGQAFLRWMWASGL